MAGDGDNKAVVNLTKRPCEAEWRGTMHANALTTFPLTLGEDKAASPTS